MRRQQRPRIPESEGEQFSNPSSSSDSSGEQDQVTEDTWVFPIVQDDARRSVFREVKVIFSLSCMSDNDRLSRP